MQLGAGFSIARLTRAAGWLDAPGKSPYFLARKLINADGGTSKEILRA